MNHDVELMNSRCVFHRIILMRIYNSLYNKWASLIPYQSTLFSLIKIIIQ